MGLRRLLCEQRQDGHGGSAGHFRAANPLRGLFYQGRTNPSLATLGAIHVFSEVRNKFAHASRVRWGVWARQRGCLCDAARNERRGAWIVVAVRGDFTRNFLWLSVAGNGGAHQKSPRLCSGLACYFNPVGSLANRRERLSIASGSRDLAVRWRELDATTITLNENLIIQSRFPRACARVH